MPLAHLRSKGSELVVERNRFVLKKFVVPAIFIFITVYFIITAPGFVRWNNLMSVLVTSSYVLVPALGLSTIMLAGSFDLSFVGIIGLTSVLMIKMTNAGLPIPVVLLMGLVVGICCEFINALLILKLGIHPWLTTISTMLATIGLEKSISKGYFLSVSHPFFEKIRFSEIMFVPLSVWIMVSFFIFMAILIHKTIFGLRLYASGGNEYATQKAGLSNIKIRFYAFIIIGISCWVASILYISQLSGYPPEAAYINLTEVILAVFFGKSLSINKSVINIPGTAVGALFVSTLANGLALSGVNAYWIKLIEGFLIIAVVITNSLGSDEIVQLEK